MRLSNATCYYYEFSPEEAIRHFGASGWDCVELSHEHTAELVNRGHEEQTGRAFIAYAAEQGVDIPQAHLQLQCDIADDKNGKTTDLLKRWLDLYMAMGVKAAVLHPGGHNICRDNKNITQAELHSLRVKALETLCAHVRNTDLHIALENVGYINTCAELNQLINDAGGKNLGICLDTGHLNLSYYKQDCFVPQLRQGEFIREAGDRLRALHVHDNFGGADEHILPFCYGDVDMVDVMTALKEIRYQHLFNLEIPTEARNIRTEVPYPIEIRYAKSKYIFDMYAYLMGLGK